MFRRVIKLQPIEATEIALSGKFWWCSVAFSIIGYLFLFELFFSMSSEAIPETSKTFLALVGIALIAGIVIGQYFGYQNVARVFIFVLPAVAICYYGLILELYWRNPPNSFFLVGGLIPNSDAAGWIGGAWRLIEFGDIDSWSQRRPINAVLHALRLFFSRELVGSITLVAMVAGLTSILAVEQVRRLYGWIAATVFFFFLLSSIDEYLPLTMTEVHGFIFGCIAFSLIWQASVSRSFILYLLGLAIISVGLSARSGPFLVYPMLVYWGVMTFRSDRFGLVAISGLSVIVLLTGPLFSFFLVKFWGDGSNLAQSNFAYTLYGMASGVGDWKQIYVDYPEIFLGNDEGQLGRVIFARSIELIREQPQVIFRYYSSEFVYFFRSFLRYDLGINPVLGLLACYWVYRNRQYAIARLPVFVFIGIALSAPFLMDTAGARPFAVFFPFLMAINALGVVTLTEKLGKYILKDGPHYNNQTIKEHSGRGLLLAACLPLGLLVATPTMIFPEKVGNRLLDRSCPDGHLGIVISGMNSVMINVYPDDELPFTRVPNIRKSDFLKYIPEGPYGERYVLAMNTVPPYSFIKTLGKQKEQIQVVVKPHLGVETYNTKVLCLIGEREMSSSYSGYVRGK